MSDKPQNKICMSNGSAAVVIRIRMLSDSCVPEWIDAAWSANSKSVTAIDIDAGDSSISKLRINLMRSLSRRGGWLFSENVFPIRELTEFQRPPEKFTFSYHKNGGFSADIIGIPCDSECLLDEFIDLIDESMQKLRPLVGAKYEWHAWTRAVHCFLRFTPILKFTKIWMRKKGFTYELGTERFKNFRKSYSLAMLPFGRMCDYDETAQFLYWNHSELRYFNNSISGLISTATHGGLCSVIQKNPPHLGGHFMRTNMDRKVLDYIVEQLNVRSFLDVGCGCGGMVAYAKYKGLNALGIDGAMDVPNTCRLLHHDFAEEGIDVSRLGMAWDLIWMVEFLEHVEENVLPNIVNLICCAKYVFTTTAKPGQDGFHHVNCRDVRYWQDWFRGLGFVKDRRLTSAIRKRSSMRSNFVRDTGILWRRCI